MATIVNTRDIALQATSPRNVVAATAAQSVKNLIDANQWVFNTTGSQGVWTENTPSSPGNDAIRFGTAPDGIQRIVWTATSGSAVGTAAEGGWNVYNQAPADSSKAYRACTWFICDVNSTGNTSGSFYLGPLYVAGVAEFSPQGSSTTDTNPYFINTARSNFVPKRWYLAVGYIFPNGNGGANIGQSGIYDGVTGKKIISGQDYQWNGANQTVLGIRSYQFYTTSSGATQSWYAPRLELMDGTEESIQSILAPAIANIANNTPKLSLSVSTNMTVVGTTVFKAGNTTAWDASVYSTNGYTGGAHVSAIIATPDSLMFGLNTDPATDDNYPGLDYALYMNGSGGLYSYETGSATSLSTYIVGDTIAISYDGKQITYYKNGVVLRVVITTITTPLFLDSSFYTPASQLNSLQFGPIGSIQGITNNDSATSLSCNPTFLWAYPTAAYPDNWTIWAGANPVKISNSRYPSIVQHTVSAIANHGITVSSTFGNSPLPVNSFLQGSFMVRIPTFNGGGKPGYLFRLYTNSALSTSVDIVVQADNASTTDWQKVSFKAGVPTGSRIYGITIYQMAAWSGMPGGSGAVGTVVEFGPFTFDVFNTLDTSNITASAITNTLTSLSTNTYPINIDIAYVGIDGLYYTPTEDCTVDITCVFNGQAQTASWA